MCPPPPTNTPPDIREREKENGMKEGRVRKGPNGKLYKQAKRPCSVRYQPFPQSALTPGGAKEPTRHHYISSSRAANTPGFHLHAAVTQASQMRVLGAVLGDAAAHQTQNVEIHVGAKSSY